MTETILLASKEPDVEKRGYDARAEQADPLAAPARALDWLVVFTSPAKGGFKGIDIGVAQPDVIEYDASLYFEVV